MKRALEDMPMGFCEHCEGQRFDRAQVLRVLRATRKRMGREDSMTTADEALQLAIVAVRTLEIPHLESFDDLIDETVIH